MYTQLDGAELLIQHHPSSGLPDDHYSLEDYLRHRSRKARPIVSANRSQPVKKPWHPFSCMPDFTFAEFATENRLKNATIDSLLKHMREDWCDGAMKITFESHKDLKRILDEAETIVDTKVVISPIPR